MKRRIFIGSSKEGLEISNTIKANIEKKCGDWIEVNIWNEGDVFTINKGTLDSLINAAMQYDYAVLVATNDDKVESRGTQHSAARDNVIFEAGLFMGALGKSRSFIVADKDINLPSDFNGTTVIFYQQNENDYINDIADSIISELNKTQHSYQLKHLPSASLALGYFDNYITVFCKNRKSSKLKVIIPKNFEEIEREISAYKTKYPSKNGIPIINKLFRSIGYKFKNKNDEYWDIPTTLQTIHKLLGKIISQTEIGKNPELDKWLEKEVYNFGHTLEELIKQDKICKDKVEIEFI